MSLVAQRTPQRFLRSVWWRSTEGSAPGQGPSKVQVDGGLARTGEARSRGGCPLRTCPRAGWGGARRRAGRGPGRWRGLWLSCCPRGSGCAAPGSPRRGAGSGPGRGATAFTSRGRASEAAAPARAQGCGRSAGARGGDAAALRSAPLLPARAALGPASRRPWRP